MTSASASAFVATGMSGKVKFYNDQKAYGFIVPDDQDVTDGRDVFFHLSDVGEDYEDKIDTDVRVRFDLREVERGFEAHNIRVVSNGFSKASRTAAEDDDEEVDEIRESARQPVRERHQRIHARPARRDSVPPATYAPHTPPAPIRTFSVVIDMSRAETMPPDKFAMHVAAEAIDAAAKFVEAAKR